MSLAITYLVANYNNGQYITDCIASLHQQTDSSWYCLIADDGSTDNSLEIIRPLLNEKIQLVVNEQNIGYIATLHKLTMSAPTDIVGILDPDDALYPEATASILKAYQTHPMIGFIYSNHDRYNEDLSRIVKPGLSSAISPRHTTLTTGFVGHLKTYKVSYYNLTLGYDEAILNAEDRDLVYKMEEVTDFHFIDKSLYKYRHVSNSATKDIERSKTGRRSHIRARRNALKRRQIKGLSYLLFMTYSYAKIHFLAHPWIVRAIAYYIRRCLEPMVKVLDQQAQRNMYHRKLEFLSK